MKKYGIIYLIRNKINNKVYIGQTTERRGFNGRYDRGGIPIEKVLKFHLSHKRCGTHYNVHLLGAIQKYGFDAFEVDTEFDIAYSKEELDKLEEMYISIYEAANPKYGYNNRKGGNNSKASKQTLMRMSEAFKGKKNPMYGRTGALCPSAKKVICLETKKTFETTVQAAKFYNLKTSSCISRCCRGKLKSAGKLNGQRLHWMYYDEYIKNPNYYDNLEFNDDIRRRKVICLETMKVYKTLTDAGKELNLNKDTIGQCARGYLQTAFGFHWMYYDEYLQQQ